MTILGELIHIYKLLAAGEIMVISLFSPSEHSFLRGPYPKGVILAGIGTN